MFHFYERVWIMLFTVPKDVAYRLQDACGTMVKMFYRRSFDDKITIEIQPIANNDIDALVAKAVIATVRAFTTED